MRWLDICRPHTQHFEGCNLSAYPDPATHGDPWTIGWGQTGPHIHKGLVWTQQQADDALDEELEKVGAQVDSVVHVPLTDNQKAALVDFTYNVGLGNLKSSTLLRRLNAGDYDVGKEFLKWTKAAGRVLPGLVKRREATKAIWEG